MSTLTYWTGSVSQEICIRLHLVFMMVILCFNQINSKIAKIKNEGWDILSLMLN